jgi:hypothetical protein
MCATCPRETHRERRRAQLDGYDDALFTGQDDLASPLLELLRTQYAAPAQRRVAEFTSARRRPGR